jgi:monothiol glutaredoxin
MEDTLRDRIQGIIDSNDVVLFMKGTKHFPQCGFSATVVEVLRRSNADFQDVNVLEDPAIRQGIKEFTNWPTIPQLYVRGQFVGAVTSCARCTKMVSSTRCSRPATAEASHPL